MFSSYLKIAIRVLSRNILISAINILGLALALTGSLLIAVFLKNELSYDHYHTKADNIYRVTRNFLSDNGGVHMHLGHVAPPFATLLKNDFPEITQTTRAYGPLRTSISDEETGTEKNYDIENGYFAEPSVFEIFSIDIMSGNKNSLATPYTMMLSDKAATQLFGRTDIVGKQISVMDTLVEVTGIYKAFPDQSHWHPDVLLSFSTLNDNRLFGIDKLQNDWEVNAFLTYVVINNEDDAKRIEKSFPSFIDKHIPNRNNPNKRSATTQIFLQPLTSIHLHSQLDSEPETNGNINNLYAMGAVGIFLIVIACCNFINLSTARATERGKEVGLRKVSGALRMQLIFQYISESMLTALLAMIVAVTVASACLPWLNDFTGKSIQLGDYMNFTSMAVMVLFVIIVGFMAGSYPAFVISGYKPSLILKGHKIASSGSGIRKALVITQFGISIVIIIATWVIYQQFEFITNKDLGYAKEQVITFRAIGDEHYEAFYNQLKQSSSVVNVTQSNLIPTSRLLNTTKLKVKGNEALEGTVVKYVSVDENFFDTYSVRLISGVNFSERGKGLILNESAVKSLGLTNEEAIGKELEDSGVIIGVVNDFHFESLHERIAPIMFRNEGDFSNISIRINASKMKEALSHVESTWHTFAPNTPFKSSFLSDRYRRLYDSEASQRELFFVFAILAIFIASLGLFGLATFNTQQRSKEVSIRKVLGASVSSIIQLLSKEIIILILISNLVAWPIAWYAMNQWLAKFAYHIDISIITFAWVALITIIVTFITISSQTLKAALTNPTEMLRSE